MNAWWGRLLELVETVPILSSCLVLRCVEEEIKNKNQTVSVVLCYLQCSYVHVAYEVSLIVYQG